MKVLVVILSVVTLVKCDTYYTISDTLKVKTCSIILFKKLITLTFYFLFYGFPSVFADVNLIHRLAMLTLSLLTVISFEI